MRTVPVLVLALLAAGCTSSGSTPSAVLATAPASPTVASPAEVEPSPSPSPTRSTATTARAVYYLRDAGSGPRLYRELHSRPATAGVIRDAVTAMLTEKAYDGDYTSLWPSATRVLGARIAQTVEGSVAYVDLSREARTGSAGGQSEAQSLQQLVWTVTAAAPAVRHVQLLVEGKAPATLWGHVSTRRPISRGQAAYVLGGVRLSLPEGVDVKRGSSIGGEASVFEATVSYEWTQRGRVVRKGFVNATQGAPGRGPWHIPVDVPPGRYLLRAFESSAEDGAPMQVDDKNVTVAS